MTLLNHQRDSVDEVLKRGFDMAMYRARARAQHTALFDPDTQPGREPPRLQLETELHNGLRRAQFLLYQPQVDSQGARLARGSTSALAASEGAEHGAAVRVHPAGRGVRA